jgi:tetratricopeptide (TPR) repeat protein
LEEEMAIIYKVTVSPAEKEAEKENRFRITWHNVEANTEDFFEQSAVEIMLDEIGRLWQQPQHQLDIGRKLFRFLDGDSHHLQQALSEADHQGESLQLHLYACEEVEDWPFELLAQGDTFLLLYRLHLVRRLSDWGAGKVIPPQNRQLKMLFMACSAIGIEPELDFEREEEAIFHITEELAIHMDVEDSGSLEGLRRRLERELYDVVHLSGHANIDKNGCPYFVMEDETGYQQKVSPDELWQKALIDNPPRLLFLSGCRTGEKPGTGAAVLFSRLLVETYHVAAVLGWGRSIDDEQATHAEKMIYRELSRGRNILDAVQRTRYELTKEFERGRDPAWPLLRLSSGGMALNAIVKEGQPLQPKPRKMRHVYLQDSGVRVLKEGFVGRRRQLQRSLRALRKDAGKVGVILLGMAGLGKSCLAGKISERFIDHTLIIVQGILNDTTLKAALNDAFIRAQDENARQILDIQKNMTEKLSHLCTTGFKEKNYLLLLDDFEQNLETVDGDHQVALLPKAADLLKVLLHYLPSGGKMTQMIITCRYRFSLTEQGRDLVREKLEEIRLTSFKQSEQLKKVRELKDILYYKDPSMISYLVSAGCGNPGLMEWLDRLARQLPEVETLQLAAAVKNKREDFIQAHGIRELFQRGDKKWQLFLSCYSIYRRPVALEGVERMMEKAGLEDWEKLLKRGMDMGLIEHDQAHRTYRLTPLLQEELLTNLGDAPIYHRIAFEYYKKICEGRETLEPSLVKEWIFHALGCGEEKLASEQGGRLVKYLRERLAFWESRQVGMWILREKKQELANEDDAFLLNETALTLKNLGDYQTAIEHYQLALVIDQLLFGQSHYTVARDLNNLGSAWRVLKKPEKAIEYYQQSLNIVEGEGFKDKHPDLAGTLLNNLGSIRIGMGDYQKSIEDSKQALPIWKKLWGERHPNVAITLNNLGAALHKSGKHPEAAENYNKALTIDLSVYGKIHPEVATDLNNLGMVYLEQDECKKAIEYCEEALSIWKKIYGQKHANIAATLSNLGEAYFKMEQKEKAKKYFEEAYGIFKDLFGTRHEYTKSVAKRLK